MNPARSLGPAIVSGDLTSAWLYIAAPLAGSAAAGVVYQLLRGAPDVEPPGEAA
jgi:glycerol uptake facilitator-like aquaporin